MHISSGVTRLLTAWCFLGPTAAGAVDARDLEEVDQPNLSRREYGAFPLLGGDTDVGFAVGGIGSIAVFAPEARPFLWRTELQGLISFKHDKDGWYYPYQDYYVKVTIPSLFHNSTRMELRLAYTKYSNLKYYGMGDATTVNRSWMSAPADSKAYTAGKEFNEYKLAYPHATFEAWQWLGNAIYLRLLLDYQYNEVLTYAGSKAVEDLASGAVIGGGSFGVGLVGLTLIYDTRDNEMSPNTGVHHKLGTRVSPGLFKHMPYTYTGINGTVRFYAPVVRDTLVVALRLVGDVLMGDVPFFTLAESEDGYALGGGKGVRGIPAQRYYGKMKVYGNLDIRFLFPPFTAFDQKSALGLVAFLDGGRLWANLRPDPALDGSGLGLKYGVGVGIRFRLGETFLLRGDAAWSPDADPLGFYFNVGELF